MHGTNNLLPPVRYILVLLLWLQLPVFGYPKNYSPFHPNNKPPTISLQCFDKSNTTENLETDFAIKTEFVNEHEPIILQLKHQKEPRGVQVALVSRDGPRPQQTWFMQDAWIGLAEAFLADLNGDETSDYVVFLWTGGVGSASDLCDVVLLLSDEQQYRAVHYITHAPRQHDFIKLPAGTHVVHSALVNGEVGRDGKKHNYWVYHLLKVKGASVQDARPAQYSFPKWIWYTFKPNHTATSQLSQEQQARCWKKWTQRYGPIFRKLRCHEAP